MKNKLKSMPLQIHAEIDIHEENYCYLDQYAFIFMTAVQNEYLTHTLADPNHISTRTADK